jgi:OmpA-like transmembrane domain
LTRIRHLSLLLMVTGQVAAADAFYVGVDLGVAFYDDVADATPISPCEPYCLADESSVNGITFSSNETAWGAVVGWNVIDWLAVELSYADLGEAGEDQQLPFGPPLIQPSIDNWPPPIFANDPITVGVIDTTSPNVGFVALGVEELALSLRLKKQLTDSFAANWSLGVSRARFETRGERRISVITGYPDTTVTEIVTSFVAPETETGLSWGLGISWDVSKRYSLDFGYRQHNTQVVDVGTITLRALASF